MGESNCSLFLSTACTRETSDGLSESQTSLNLLARHVSALSRSDSFTCERERDRTRGKQPWRGTTKLNRWEDIDLTAQQKTLETKWLQGRQIMSSHINSLEQCATLLLLCTYRDHVHVKLETYTWAEPHISRECNSWHTLPSPQWCLNWVPSRDCM